MRTARRVHGLQPSSRPCLDVAARTAHPARRRSRLPRRPRMPRFSRPIPAGLCAHLVTRGNARATVFHSDEDYRAFLDLIRAARARLPIDLFAWCLMPNHVHLVLRCGADGDIGRWMHWLLTTHVQRHRRRHGTTGRIWQGRYRAFPIQADEHLLTVLRYVERNPVRAGLTHSAADWPWSSAADRRAGRSARCDLSRSPVPLPEPWAPWVDTPLTSAELDAVQRAVRYDRPYGDAIWSRRMTDRLDLPAQVRPRGRPRNL